MGGQMPYVFGSNPFFATLESTGRREHRVAGLRRLVGGDAMWMSAVLAGQDEQLVKHLRAHWFGYHPGATSAGSPAPESNLGTTGWWKGWQGDAHEVVRQTFQRAYQASLGVADPKRRSLTVKDVDKLDPKSGVCRPIRILWMCSSATVQGFVFPQGAGPDDVVLVVVSTPGVDTDWRPQPGDPKAFGLGIYNAVEAGGTFDPNRKGGYVIGHEKVVKRTKTATLGIGKTRKNEVLVSQGSVITADVFHDDDAPKTKAPKTKAATKKAATKHAPPAKGAAKK